MVILNAKISLGSQSLVLEDNIEFEIGDPRCEDRVLEFAEEWLKELKKEARDGKRLSR